MEMQKSYESSQDFITAVTAIGKKVSYRENPQGFYPKGNRNGREISFEEVENMLMDELLKTELHYDNVGETEFQKLLNHGIKVLDGSRPLELESDIKEKNIGEVAEAAPPDLADEDEDENGEIEEDEEDEETPMGLLCEFVSEIIEEVQANEDIDDDYLHQRIEMGLKTRKIEVILK